MTLRAQTIERSLKPSIETLFDKSFLGTANHVMIFSVPQKMCPIFGENNLLWNIVG